MELADNITLNVIKYYIKCNILKFRSIGRSVGKDLGKSQINPGCIVILKTGSFNIKEFRDRYFTSQRDINAIPIF